MPMPKFKIVNSSKASKASKASSSTNSPELTITEKVSLTIHDLKTKFGETKITVSTIHNILKSCIELVDKFNCPGTEKKKYVIFIIKELVNDLVTDENEKKIIIIIIDEQLLENTIDIIIDASKGRLDINNRKNRNKILNYGYSTAVLLWNICLLGCKK